MNEPIFTTALIIVEVLFSVMLLRMLHKAGAKKEVPLVLGVILASWLGTVYLLLSSGFISSTAMPRVTFTAMIVIPIILGLLAQRYWKPFGETVEAIRTETFISLQQMRAVFGVMFFFTASLPLWFQYVGGLGDIAAGVGAFFALVYLKNNPDKEQSANIRGNIVGILDFIVVLNLGVFAVLQENSADITFALIPLYVVPLFILLHIFSLQKLRKTGVCSRESCIA